eukprot:g781.t1
MKSFRQRLHRAPLLASARANMSDGTGSRDSLHHKKSCTSNYHNSFESVEDDHTSNEGEENHQSPDVIDSSSNLMIGSGTRDDSSTEDEKRLMRMNSVTSSSRIVAFQDNLWLRGKAVGAIEGSLVFTRVPMSMQLLGGVLTEDGVVVDSSLISRGTPTPRLKESTKSNRLTFVYRSQEDLMRTQRCFLHIIRRSLEKLQSTLPHHLKIQIFSVILPCLKRTEISHISHLGYDTSLSSTSPNNERQILRVDELLRSNPDHVHAFSGSYRELLIDLISFALKEMESQAYHFEEASHFFATIMAIGAIRIPRFGQIINTVILSPGERNIALPEWKAHYYSIQHVSNSELSPSSSGHFTLQETFRDDFRAELEKDDLFKVQRSQSFLVTTKRQEFFLNVLNWNSWEAALFKFSKEKDENLLSKLQNQEKELNGLENKRAFLRLAKRGRFFCLYGIYFMQECIDRLILFHKKGSPEPSFHEIPGYVVLLKALLLEMKNRDVIEYSQLMKEFISFFLMSPWLLDPFLTIILRKTSAFNIAQISTTLTMAQEWVLSLNKWHRRYALYHFPLGCFNRERLPLEIDMTLLSKAICILCSPGLPNQGTLKAIEFCYNIWDLLPETSANNLRQLFAACHHNLFFHWNAITRGFYINLLVFRLLKPCRWTDSRTHSLSSHKEHMRDYSLINNRVYKNTFRLICLQFKVTILRTRLVALRYTIEWTKRAKISGKGTPPISPSYESSEAKNISKIQGFAAESLNSEDSFESFDSTMIDEDDEGNDSDNEYEGEYEGNQHVTKEKSKLHATPAKLFPDDQKKKYDEKAIEALENELSSVLQQLKSTTLEENDLMKFDVKESCHSLLGIDELHIKYALDALALYDMLVKERDVVEKEVERVLREKNHRVKVPLPRLEWVTFIRDVDGNIVEV